MSDSFPSLTGKLILDSGQLAGTYFDRSAILMCAHDSQGAFGLVVNRPTRHKLGEALRDPPSELFANVPLHLGGPVQTALVSFLLADSSHDGAGVMLAPWLQWCRSFEEAENCMETNLPLHKIRAFLGYAGWSSGQLEKEMESGAWIVHPLDPSLIFSKKPERVWTEILRSLGGVHRLVAESPSDPTLN